MNSINQYEQRTVLDRFALAGDAAASATVGVTVNEVPLAVVQRHGASGVEEFWTVVWLTDNTTVPTK